MSRDLWDLTIDEQVVVLRPSLVRAIGMSEAAVLQQIAYRYANQGEEIGELRWAPAPVADLARETGLSERQVKRVVVWLENTGVIESCQPESYNRRKWYRPGPNRILQGDNLSPSEGDKVAPSSSTRTEEPTQELKLQVEDLPSEPVPARDPVAEEFVEWYAEYPRRMDRRAALKAYRKARAEGASAADLLAAARAFSAAMASERREPTKIKYPATFLNAGTWEDYIGAGVNAPTGQHDPAEPVSDAEWERLVNLDVARLMDCRVCGKDAEPNTGYCAEHLRDALAYVTRRDARRAG